jgi:septal ring factor EnvC (AmiA/AmiB activator)
MEKLIIAAFNLITTNSPTVLTLIFSSIALIAGFWFFSRKTNIEEATSVGTLQHQQIEGLLKQVQYLSDELAKARNQLAQIHDQNVKLMLEVRTSNLKIQELEDIINRRNL